MSFTDYEKYHLHDYIYSKSEVDQSISNELAKPKISNTDMGNNKIINVKEGTNDDDCVTKKQLDLKLDRSVFLVTNSIPGIPVLDSIAIALIPSLTLLSVDATNKISSWLDPVNRILYSQTNNSKKPLLKRNSTKKLFYLEFDGSDDFLINTGFDTSSLAGKNGNMLTLIMIVNTKQTKNQSQFQWGTGAVRFGVHVPWSDGKIYIDFGNINGGRLEKIGESNLNGNIEVWTIRVSGIMMQLYRGVSSIAQIENALISTTLSGSGDITIGSGNLGNGNGTNFSKMDLYGLFVWSKSLNDDKLMNMFRFIQNYYNL